VTWQWQNGDTWGSETLVTVDFKPVGDKTEMTMTHSGFADEKQKEMHNQGWSSSFNKLEKILG
ncbi:SRPBCC domain-containing protein, partial [Candidatus Kaiserbacteria bacterium]|nr:SRPBCC domain-containing protein [Candidatus Kaiserbacteria bacterium]